MLRLYDYANDVFANIGSLITQSNNAELFDTLATAISTSHKNVLNYIKNARKAEQTVSLRFACYLCYRLSLESTEVSKLLTANGIDRSSPLALHLELYSADVEIRKLFELASSQNSSDNVADPYALLGDVKTFVSDVLDMINSFCKDTTLTRADFIEYKTSLRERYSVFDRLSDIL